MHTPVPPPPEQVILSEAPTIHPDALVIDTQLGAWTEVGRGTTIRASEMGAYSYLTQHCEVVWSTIGKFCSIANYTRLNPGNHPTWSACQHHAVYRAAAYGLGEDDADFFAWRQKNRVTLGHDVWLGHAVVVTPGVTIGTGAVVGANAVVTRDVAPYQIVAGSPARPIRARAAPAQVDALLDIAWWDWPREKFGAALSDFRTLSIPAFVEKYERTGS